MNAFVPQYPPLLVHVPWPDIRSDGEMKVYVLSCAKIEKQNLEEGFLIVYFRSSGFTSGL